VSTSESQVYARALFDGLVGDAQKALKAVAKRLDGAQGDAATLEQQAIAALPAEAPREVRNFLVALARDGKLDLLPAVVQSFEQYGQSNARPLTGEVITRLSWMSRSALRSPAICASAMANGWSCAIVSTHP
jgi:F0F1-type ATP synthase delta subunit